MSRRKARGEIVVHREAHMSGSFRMALLYSLRGIVYAFHTETNLKRDFWLFSILCLIELTLRPPASAVALTLFVAMCVFAAELFNTAIELTVDLAVDWHNHPVAAVAKDVASGAVTMVSLGAFVVAGWLLVEERPWRFRLFTSIHLMGAAMVLFSLLVVWFLRFWPYRSRGMIKRRRVEDIDGV